MGSLTFLTVSMGTRWEAYGQAVLDVELPRTRKIIVDGRFGWHPTLFLDHLADVETDYVVLIDEDCFVCSGHSLKSLISILDERRDLAAAGVPDGGTYYRNHNPAALNLFFVVFRTAALKAALQPARQGDTDVFRPEYALAVNDGLPDLDHDRINVGDGEPYYWVFWRLLQRGWKFLYLQDRVDNRDWASRVSVPGSDIICVHLWYLRLWFSDECMPGHDCANRERYQAIERKIRQRYRWSGRFWIGLLTGHARRLLRRFKDEKCATAL